MRTSIVKRSLSMLMVLVMIFSMLPVQAFAEESHDHEHEESGVVSEALVVDDHDHDHGEGGDAAAAASLDGCVHEYYSVVVDPTVDAEGYTLHTCALCGDSYQDSFTEKLPGCAEHDFVVVDSLDAMCELDGYIQYECSVCGETTWETIPALEHEYVTTVVEPTAESMGYTLYFCPVCEYEYKGDWVSRLYEMDENLTLVEQVQFRIDAILTTYLGGTELTEDEVLLAAEELWWEDLEAAQAEINQLDAFAAGLSEEEFASLQRIDTLVTFIDFLDERMSVSTYKTVTVLDGKVSVADSAGSISASGNTVTATARVVCLARKRITLPSLIIQEAKHSLALTIARQMQILSK